MISPDWPPSAEAAGFAEVFENVKTIVRAKNIHRSILFIELILNYGKRNHYEQRLLTKGLNKSSLTDSKELLEIRTVISIFSTKNEKGLSS